MALVKFGAGVVDMRGSIAGTTFSRNASGNIARARTKPVNPKTNLQDNIKSSMAVVTTAWSQDLDNAQRTAWNLYASNVSMLNGLGETTYHSGFNHFVRSNVIRRQSEQALILDGPVIFELPEQDPSFAMIANETDQEVEWSYDNTLAWAVEDGGKLYLFEGKPQNPQRNFFGGPWRLSGMASGVDPGGAPTPYARPTQWGIAELQRLWGYARIQRADGRLSERFRTDCFVTENGV